MSHRSLQRALVVALHDPDFVAAMHRDADAALAGFDLSASERTQLLAVDRRAFAVDRLRARRLLRVLVDELKAATAIALAEVRSLAFADGFFASPSFHRAVAEDTSLVPAFGDYLSAARVAGRLRSPHLPGVLAIELGRARARRSADRPPGPGVGLAPGVAVLATTAPALDAIQLIEGYLFEVGLLPHLALVDDRPPLPALPDPTGPPLHLAFRPQCGDITLEVIEPPLFVALAALAATRAVPLDREAAAAVLGGLGLPLSRPAHLLDQLIGEGLVCDGSRAVA